MLSKRCFNIAGPCVSGEHYMLDPLRGIERELMNLIDDRQYFVIHAARQSGKTTLLLELVDRIKAKGDYYVLYCSIDNIEKICDPKDGIQAIVRTIKNYAGEQGLPEGFAKNADYDDFSGVLKSSLVSYCRSLDKPLVMFFDEADCLSNGTLIAFLRQLRGGYVTRSKVPFVRSIALVGMRNLRDYRARIREDSETLGSASPFNIVKESLNLRNFTNMEVAELYAQHTAETGQIFQPDAADYAFEQTQGQPWLVNAIACECVEKITKKDYSAQITADLTKQAIQNLVTARGTHFDSLLERLKEPRVRNVIQPLITGDDTNEDSDDYLYTRDLGLIRESGGKTVPANPIYAELIIRTLNRQIQKSIENTYKDCAIPRYLKNGRIDMNFLITEFQTCWRENSEIWIKRYEKELYQYDEAAPHLVMQAFLQRVVNGGGQVTREMALGTKRADLCVIHEGQKYPIEIKILQNERNRADSLKQIADYADMVGSHTGWLIIFDRDEKKSWDEKIYMTEETVNGKKIVVAGC